MFASIKQWINIPFQYKPFIKYSGAGTKQYASPIDAKCYAEGDIKLVTNSEGSEVTSSTQLYIDGSENIKVTDSVIFDGEERPILRINSFYRDGRVDIKVVYL